MGMRLMVWATMSCVLTLSLTLVPNTSLAKALKLGGVVDNATNSLTVFDANSYAVRGTVPLDSSGVLGDCSIAGNSALAFVTDFRRRLWVIDLGGSAPQLASGVNPIPISNPGEDTSITLDERYVLVCDGGNVAAVSAVDIARRIETSTLQLQWDCNSVDVCSDGSVLVTSRHARSVRRLLIDESGYLTDTGEELVLPIGVVPNNVVCSPSARSGVVVTRAGTASSFTLPGLKSTADVDLVRAGMGISAVISPGEDRVYVRTASDTVGSAVKVYGFDGVLGRLGATAFASLPASTGPLLFGVDQVALAASGSRLFISDGDTVKIYNTSSWRFDSAITSVNLADTAGICLPRAICGDNVVGPGEECDDGNVLDGDCCSSSCRLESDGTPCAAAAGCPGSGVCDGEGICLVDGVHLCDDRNPCTRDTCDPLAGCVNRAEPVESCRFAAISRLNVKIKRGNDRGTLVWRWNSGDRTTAEDLGDPTTDTAYAVCLYDRAGNSSHLVARAQVPPNALWKKPRRKPGMRFDSVSGEFDGVERIYLRPGTTSRAKMRLRVAKSSFDTSVDGAGGLFSVDPRVTIQLSNSTGTCWTSDFDGHSKRVGWRGRFVSKTKPRRP